MKEIEELKKRAGITEQGPDKIKAFMDMQTLVAMLKDVGGHAEAGVYSPEALLILIKKTSELTRQLGDSLKAKRGG